MTTTTARAGLLAVAAATATAALGTALAAPAHAGPPPRVEATALGTYAADGTGVTYAGEFTGGAPFAGTWTGRMAADDGSFPPLGSCEPATATLRVLASGRDDHYEVAATGQVCGILLPLGTMHQFTGSWVVVDTDVKQLRRSEGVIDLRLLNGQSDVYVQGR